MFSHRLLLYPFASVPYLQRILSLGSIALYPQNEASGTTIVDNSGNGRNGTYSAVTLGAAGIGDGQTAASYNGTTSYGNIYSTSLRNAFDVAAGTLAAWARVANAGVWTDGVNRNVIRIDSATAGNLVFIRKSATANELRVQRSGGAVADFVSTTTLAGVTAWFHVAITWSIANDRLRLYVNGSQVGATQTGLGAWAGLPNAMTIGAANTVPAEPWSGTIAYAGIWNRELTATEVQSIGVL